MNLTWHIAKKDLRALKWPLALWTLLIVAKLGVGLAMLTAYGPGAAIVPGTGNADWFANWFVRMDIMARMLAALECVSFVLVAAMIQEDLLVGTTAFWQTRPISGARLLRAKLLGIGLAFLVLPVLVTLPWWLFCGLGGREIAWAATEILVIQTGFILLGLLWSVVTDSFSRFLLWTLVLLFAIPSVGGIIGFHLSQLPVKPTAALLWTRTTVEVAIAVLAILVVTVHQFLTRSTPRSIAIIGSAAGLVIATALWWPWNWDVNAQWKAWLEARPERVQSMGSEPAGLKFTVGPVRLTAKPGGAAGMLNQIQARFSVTGIPEARVLLPINSTYNLRWADGGAESGRAWTRPEDDIFRLISLRSLNLPEPEGPGPGRQDFSFVDAFLPLDTVARVQAERPGLTLRSVFQLAKFDAATKVPLQPGARSRKGSVTERIAYVESGDHQDTYITFIRSRPDLYVDNGENRYRLPSARMLGIYGLVNQTEGKFSTGYTQGLNYTRVASVEISLQMVGYGGLHPAGKKGTAGANWLRGAELFRHSLTEEVRFVHETQIERFPAEPETH